MRRRRFVKLMAASAAAILAQPIQESLAAPAKRAAAGATAAHALPPALRKEIANQKKSVADTLRAIRAYELPPGSRPAFVFRAERRRTARG
ncbi:MAG TPA: hypothetical protein VK123_03945 [Candidatus Limnocylindrales bacterium]|nr:hypothetical protein [Candidatus Limnocylindrales bacterium]